MIKSTNQPVEVKQLCNFCLNTLTEQEKENKLELSQPLINLVVNGLFVLELWDPSDQCDAGSLYLDKHLTEVQIQHICDIIANMEEHIWDWNYDEIAEAIARFLERNGVNIIKFQSKVFEV